MQKLHKHLTKELSKLSKIAHSLDFKNPPDPGCTIVFWDDGQLTTNSYRKLPTVFLGNTIARAIKRMFMHNTVNFDEPVEFIPISVAVTEHQASEIEAVLNQCLKVAQQIHERKIQVHKEADAIIHVETHGGVGLITIKTAHVDVLVRVLEVSTSGKVLGLNHIAHKIFQCCSADVLHTLLCSWRQSIKE